MDRATKKNYNDFVSFNAKIYATQFICKMGRRDRHLRTEKKAKSYL